MLVVVIVIIVLILTSMLLTLIVTSIVLVWIVCISVVISSVIMLILVSYVHTDLSLTIHHSIHHLLDDVLLRLAGEPGRRNHHCVHCDHNIPGLGRPGNMNRYFLLADDGRSHHRNDPAEGVLTYLRFSKDCL